MYGWTGKILVIDLGKRTVEELPTAPHIPLFVGGRGIGARLFYEFQRPRIDPFDPNNVIIFSTGPLSGTSFPAAGRVDVTTKSPLTFYRVVSNIGGFFGPELKFAGVDHLIIKGNSDVPVYVYVENEKVEILDAGSLWGKGTYDTMASIRRELDDTDVKIVSIGPAGENLVRFANVMSEMGFSSGRGGIGAVMGSKRLKAIAVRGTKDIQIFNPSRFLEETIKYHDKLLQRVRGAPESEYYADTLDPQIKEHLVFGNYEDGDWDHEESDPEEVMREIQIKRVGCFSCPLRCMHLVRLEGLECSLSTCEPFWNFTRLIWNNDIRTAWRCIYLVNQYGMDSVETGGLIAYLMELYGKGIIDSTFTDGIPMEKGNRDAILQTLSKIAGGEGFGQKLKDGAEGLAHLIGEEAEAIRVTSHNMFPHGYYFQAYKGAALLQAVGHSKGDCFPTYGSSIEMGIGPNIRLKGVASGVANERYGDSQVFNGSENVEGIVKMVIDTEHLVRIPDLLGICLFVGNIYTDTKYYEKLSGVLFEATGVKMSEGQLFAAAERLRNMERLIDIREGLSKSDDCLPRRFFENPMKSGHHKGKVMDPQLFENLKDRYYELRGWDKCTGKPTREKLLDLGLDIGLGEV